MKPAPRFRAPPDAVSGALARADQSGADPRPAPAAARPIRAVVIVVFSLGVVVVALFWVVLSAISERLLAPNGPAKLLPWIGPFQSKVDSAVTLTWVRKLCGMSSGRSIAPCPIGARADSTPSGSAESVPLAGWDVGC